MLEDNQTVEVMIHLMEFGVVAGMVAVVAFTLARHKKIVGLEDPSLAGVAQDPGADQG